MGGNRIGKTDGTRHFLPIWQKKKISGNRRQKYPSPATSCPDEKQGDI
jgi:hypothetical protein